MDYLTYSGANELAKRIRLYWAERGKTVSTYVEVHRLPNAGGNLGGDLYCVRSNMVNGSPQ